VKYKNLKWNKEKIAMEAWEQEVKTIGLFGGKQDQFASALGGINLFEFGPKSDLMILNCNHLYKIRDHMSLFYLGSNRSSAKIQEGLRKITPEQKIHLDKIKRSVNTMFNCVVSEEWDRAGNLLNKMWEEKKLSNKGVSNPQIEELCRKARRLGAWGGKVLGAGDGGHLMFLSPLNVREKLKEELGIRWVDFNIDYNGVDARIC